MEFSSLPAKCYLEEVETTVLMEKATKIKRELIFRKTFLRVTRAKAEQTSL